MMFKKNEILFMSKLMLLLVFVFCGRICFAALDYEPADKLKEIAKNFVLQNAAREPDETIDVQVSQSNSSLLPVCTNQINVALPKDSTRNQITAVELSCNGINSWQTFVPVTVQIYTKVIVAKHMMSPKDTISEPDLDYASMDKTRLFNGYFKTKEEILGLEATQMLSAGAVFTKTNLQKPVLVHRNETIDLIAGTDSVVVTMKGMSKSDGRLNDMIKAVNPSSNRTLDAVVVGSNKAKIVS